MRSGLIFRPFFYLRAFRITIPRSILIPILITYSNYYSNTYSN
ncbi:hypothetical protein VPH526E571_0011 [Vibrio phage 526E57-1]